MNKLYFRPIDVLSFKDTRPMEGSLSGHSQLWPTPDLIDHAIRASLHREQFQDKSYKHYDVDKGKRRDQRASDDKPNVFGSLTVGGVYPVHKIDESEQWYFPRPLDIETEVTLPILAPVQIDTEMRSCSSLASPLLYPIGKTCAPSKNIQAPDCFSLSDYTDYVQGENRPLLKKINFNDFVHREPAIGIEIDDESGVAGVNDADAEGKIYSTEYLRFNESWYLGSLAETQEINKQDPNGPKVDIIPDLVRKNSKFIMGGQRKSCETQCISLQADEPLPLPLGIHPDALTPDQSGKYRIKWILLTPAVWPIIEENKEKNIPEHKGGWLPTWVHSQTGDVMLKHALQREENESRPDFRNRMKNQPFIKARLVAALTGKALIISGWSINEQKKVGAKSTQLAVPAGSVYYFECDDRENAEHLLHLLNWHGSTPGTHIVNRRSSLLGEKGFGLGICAPWSFLTPLS